MPYVVFLCVTTINVKEKLMETEKENFIITNSLRMLWTWNCFLTVEWRQAKGTNTHAHNIGNYVYYDINKDTGVMNCQSVCKLWVYEAQSQVNHAGCNLNKILWPNRAKTLHTKRLFHRQEVETRKI